MYYEMNSKNFDSLISDFETSVNSLKKMKEGFTISDLDDAEKSLKKLKELIRCKSKSSDFYNVMI